MADANTVVKSLELKGVKIVSVTSTSRIMDIANEKQINPQEVFVRIAFNVTGSTELFQASNKLRVLRESGYKALLDAKNNNTPIDITVSEDGFFYIHRDVEVSTLFATPVESKVKDSSALFTGNTGKKRGRPAKVSDVI